MKKNIKRNQKVNEAKPEGKTDETNTSRKPPKWFYAVPFLLPVILIILLEFSLRTFNYGRNIETWIPYHPELPGKLVLNTEIASKYFLTTKGIPSSIFDPFDAVKKPGTFRVFVLGESSAAGFPYEPTGSYSRYIRDRLQLVYPKQNIEVVNVSMAAINSIVIKDMLPEILKQEPDLILLYVGHNEYYGVFGAASQSLFAGNKTMLNLMLTMNEYKTVQLLRNIVNTISFWFKGKGKDNGATLMARMASNNLVPYKSKLYQAGLTQFEGELSDIIQMIKEKNVPLIMGTLTSNLKDQPPFISINEPVPQSGKKVNGSADHFYKLAEESLKKGNAVEAKKLFTRAKELDALRFRAPEEMNDIIKKLAGSNQIPLVDFETAFSNLSENNIVGNNLMVDHLHPTLHGYQIFGKLFFEAMEKNNFLPDAERINISDEEQHALVVKNFPFSRLDSTIANFRLLSLKGDFPFNKDGKSKTLLDFVKLTDYNDSLAYKVVEENYYWELAHKKLATYYLGQRNYYGFMNEYSALIGQFPYTIGLYEKVVQVLLETQKYSEAYIYLEKYYKLQPDAFCTKWLGTINLFNNNDDLALRYLKESFSFNPRDAQLLWNLSGVFVKKKDYANALTFVKKCLEVESNFPGAAQMKMQLEQAR
ncbi:MAG: GDSL-type esterase/lipase family protein [Ignavibacteriaceae bacterium]|nr:GDSL-type esterase/lipase family protein [Ignavibacteriaceae bacterium]